jgi:heme exporter protein A
MHQRLTIARALIHNPSLLLLDEPYTGLDPLSADRLSRQIDEAATSGAAVILTTHDVEQGLGIADRVAILESGRVAYQGSGKHDPEAFRKKLLELTHRP